MPNLSKFIDTLFSWPGKGWNRVNTTLIIFYRRSKIVRPHFCASGWHCDGWHPKSLCGYLFQNIVTCRYTRESTGNHDDVFQVSVVLTCPEHRFWCSDTLFVKWTTQKTMCLPVCSTCFITSLQVFNIYLTHNKYIYIYIWWWWKDDDLVECDCSITYMRLFIGKVYMGN